MTRARDQKDLQLRHIHEEREQLNEDRRRMSATFAGLVAERRVLIESVRQTSEASRARRRSRTV
jgi:hypothetical protein